MRSSHKSHAYHKSYVITSKLDKNRVFAVRRGLNEEQRGVYCAVA